MTPITTPARCRGLQDADICAGCTRKADEVEPGGAFYYASPPVVRYKDAWHCGARVPEQDVAALEVLAYRGEA